PDTSRSPIPQHNRKPHRSGASQKGAIRTALTNAKSALEKQRDLVVVRFQHRGDGLRPAETRELAANVLETTLRQWLWHRRVMQQHGPKRFDRQAALGRGVEARQRTRN